MVLPPPVRLALAIFASVRGAVREEGSHEAVFWWALAQWLPAPLYDELTPLPISDVVTMALSWAVPATPETEDDGPPLPLDEALDRVSLHPWEEALSDYCATYGADPWTTLTETPWPVFVTLCRQVPRQVARHQYHHIETQSLIHMRDRVQQRSRLDTLARRAGRTDDRPDLSTMTDRERDDYLTERSKKGLANLQALATRGRA